MLNHSLWQFFSSAGPVVQIVMAILLTASVISWTLIIQRMVLLKRVRRASQLFYRQFQAGEDLYQLYQQGSQTNEQALQGVQNVYNAGFAEYLRMKQRDIDSQSLLKGISRAMTANQTQQFMLLEQNLSLLATIGSISPYIGLFGTVWGIMTSFQALGAVQQATIAMVAPGISEALIATAMGLFAAIPAVIAYNRFSYHINRLAEQYDAFSNEFLNLLTRQLHLAPKAATPTEGMPCA